MNSNKNIKITFNESTEEDINQKRRIINAISMERQIVKKKTIFVSKPKKRKESNKQNTLKILINTDLEKGLLTSESRNSSLSTLKKTRGPLLFTLYNFVNKMINIATEKENIDYNQKFELDNKSPSEILREELSKPPERKKKINLNLDDNNEKRDKNVIYYII